MALAATSTCTIRLASPSPSPIHRTKLNFRFPTASSLPSRPPLSLSTTGAYSPIKLDDYKGHKLITAYSHTGYGGGDGIGHGRSYGGGGGGGEEEEGLLQLGWLRDRDEASSFESDIIRAILAEAIRRSKIPALLRPLLQSPGLDFITKIPMAIMMECGAGVLLKAEYEKRKERFSNHLQGVVYADLTMAANADFMLLGRPTVSLPPPIPLQAALGGTSYSLLHRLAAATSRSRTMLVVAGTASALVGTIVADNLINAKKAVHSEPEDIPLSTRVKYGLCMALVTNLGYQLLAGGVKPRLVERYSHQSKLMLSADCDFQVLTENQSGSQMPRNTAFCLNGAIGLKSSYMALIDDVKRK